MPGQTFAYLRVSKMDQDLEKNKADILKLANEAHLGGKLTEGWVIKIPSFSANSVHPSVNLPPRCASLDILKLANEGRLGGKLTEGWNFDLNHGNRHEAISRTQRHIWFPFTQMCKFGAWESHGTYREGEAWHCKQWDSLPPGSICISSRQ